MNAGELLEVFTGGLLSATRHRVADGRGGRGQEIRQSLVLFIIPGNKFRP